MERSAFPVGSLMAYLFTPSLGGGWGTRAPTHPSPAKEASGGCTAPLLSCKAPFSRGYGDFCCATRPLFNVLLFLSLARQNLAAAGLGECGCLYARGAFSESVSGMSVCTALHKLGIRASDCSQDSFLHGFGYRLLCSYRRRISAALHPYRNPPSPPPFSPKLL